jgi:hypothetical protein
LKPDPDPLPNRGKKKPPRLWHREGRSLFDDQNPRGALSDETTTTATEMAEEATAAAEP